MGGGSGERDGERVSEASVPKPGDYVLATKFHDGDPGDQWAVGFLNRIDDRGGGDVRYLVVDSHGKQFRANGFGRVARIRKDVGQWLVGLTDPAGALSTKPGPLERSPPGTVSLWGMLTEDAFERDEANAEEQP